MGDVFGGFGIEVKGCWWVEKKVFYVDLFFIHRLILLKVWIIVIVWL